MITLRRLDKTPPYLGVVVSSRDETTAVGKLRLSAFKRRQDRHRMRPPRRDRDVFGQSNLKHHLYVVAHVLISRGLISRGQPLLKNVFFETFFANRLNSASHVDLCSFGSREHVLRG